MSTRYVFNTSGDYVAFISDGHLFSASGEWLGVVSNNREIHKPDGNFLGQLTSDDRVVWHSSDGFRTRVIRPLRPIKPLRPIRPIRRLRMPRLPNGYQDVFEVSPLVAADFGSTRGLEWLEDKLLFAQDGTFLGKISKNRFSMDSISNQFGPHGNRYASTSIFNKFGQYGSSFGAQSPFNQFAQTPPRVMDGNQFVRYLTSNKFLSPRISPEEFLAWLA
jgi:hypothetical protein